MQPPFLRTLPHLWTHGIGANPSLTITALSERCIEHIIAEDFG